MWGVAEGSIWLGQMGGQEMIFNKPIFPCPNPRSFQEPVYEVSKIVHISFIYIFYLLSIITLWGRYIYYLIFHNVIIE